MTTTTGVTTGVTIGMTTAGPAPRTARYATAVPPGRSTAELLEDRPALQEQAATCPS